MDFAHPRRVAPAWQWGVLMLSAALLAGACMYLQVQQAELRHAQQTLASERTAFASQARASTNHASATVDATALKRIKAIYATLDLSWTPIFESLENARTGTNNRVRIASISHVLDDGGEFRFHLSGSAADQTALLQYVRTLGELGTSKATLLTQKPEPGQPGLAFTLEVAWKQSAADSRRN
ncbi:hypothetical protein [Ramlibacter humi]|uniref:Fimbrial assembly protein n=1 Tax=Ramlibacter humi TaxID=2530451 RepID=A0A4Z0BB80_9BURK|nr:hypothetical protein [Ramlibacter humi]TFY96365.1 hypothetical protein EZ216_20740 [Ramlibacter humi]